MGLMRIEDAQRLTPGTRVICPAEGEETARSCLVVGVGSEPDEDLFGDPFVWVMVRDPQKGGTALVPSNHVSREREDHGEGEAAAAGRVVT